MVNNVVEKHAHLHTIDIVLKNGNPSPMAITLREQKEKEGKIKMSDPGYFMLSNQPKKKADQNCVAYAAYCADQSLYDGSEDRLHTFKGHDIQPVSFIMKPEYAPQWTLNREKLWNEVKKNEKGANWRTHRDLKLSLPIGFPKDQYLAMTKEFVKENITDPGMVGDVHIHLDHENNPHVHILCTVRPFNEDGSWGDKKVNVPRLDEEGSERRNEKGWKVYQTVAKTNWDTKEFLESQRCSWAAIHNKYAELNQMEPNFDHRSYAKQGIDKEATVRLSRRNYEVEKQQIERSKALHIPYEPVTEWGEYNEIVRKGNEAIQHKKKIEAERLHEIKAIYQKNVFNLERDLTDFQRQASQIVLRKAKGKAGTSLANLDYLSSKTVHLSTTDIHSKWYDYLQREKMTLETQNQFYQLMVKKYKENPSFVAIYGLPRELNAFKQLISEKTSELKGKSEAFHSQFSAYTRERDAAAFVYQNQIERVTRTFEEIYGTESAAFTTDEKDFAIHQALSGSYIRQEQIKVAFKEKGTEYSTIDYMSLARRVNQAQLIAERTIRKIQREIKQNEAVPQTEGYVQLLQTEKIRDYYKASLTTLKPALIRQFEKDHQTISSLSTGDLLKMSEKELLSFYYNTDVGQVNGGMKTPESKASEGNELEEGPGDIHSSFRSTDSLSAGIVGALGGLEQSQQAKITEKKAKKNRKKRHRDDDLYHE